MVAIFTRNCQPEYALRGTRTRAWFFREALLAGRWTENSNDGDPAWTSALNLVLDAVSGVNGLDVEAAYPRQVKSPNGDFLESHVGKILNLDAANDQNRGLWRISEYIDANTVKVDHAGWFPDVGWADESDMDARVTTVAGLAPSAGAWILMDSPAGYNVQVRILFQDDSHCYVYVRPRGKLGDLTEISSGNLGSFYGPYIRLQLFFDGLDTQVLMTDYLTNSGAYHASGFILGSLLDADPADTDPIFLMASNYGFDNLHPYELSIQMLDSVLAQIDAYAMSVKPALGQNPDSTEMYSMFGRRLLGGSGLAALRSPWVVLGNRASTGACVRGRLPVLRSTYTGFERFTPMDAAGTWQHLSAGSVIPRNGPQDPLIMWPEV
jgi:hypothetical protein